MKANATFVWTNSIVVLNAISHIGVSFPLIIYPCYSKLVYSIGNTQTFDKVFLFEFWVLVVDFFDRNQYLLNCLMIFRFIWESPF